MPFAFGLNGSVSLSNIYFIIFTGNAVYTKDFQTELSLADLSMCNQKNIHMLRSAKDKLGVKVPGMYCILCEYGKVYVGQQ
jgi:hypothetical protein